MSRSNRSFPGNPRQHRSPIPGQTDPHDGLAVSTLPVEIEIPSGHAEQITTITLVSFSSKLGRAHSYQGTASFADWQ